MPTGVGDPAPTASRAFNYDSFGRDEFGSAEPAPPGVPDGGSTLALLSLGFAGMGMILRRKR